MSHSSRAYLGSKTHPAWGSELLLTIRYFTKAISWARKYGIRILLDYHALPGSQNGWNHSGKSGQINWMYGVMGIVNAQRHLETLRTLTQYISQPGIKEVVPM
jgi:glucan 1,3-beta-glucosidase